MNVDGRRIVEAFANRIPPFWKLDATGTYWTAKTRRGKRH